MGSAIVLCQDYPSEENPYAMGYVHSRVKEYLKHGISVKVLSFSTISSYEYEGVSVYGEKEIGEYVNEETVFLSHAPNVKNHLRFLVGKIKKARCVVLFFHGHEVMRRVRDYPKPYEWNRRGLFKNIIIDIYDSAKFIAMRHFLLFYGNKIKVVFVSDWMKSVFLKRIRPYGTGMEAFIINNPVNEGFVSRTYRYGGNKEYDFVTIRPLTESKYCIDLVVDAARNNPSKKFLLVGKGNFFDHRKDIPPNLTWWNRFCAQKEIPELLDNCRCALMPTRLDAQGVMSCEIATYGMPLITSDIPVCKEMLLSFPNVSFIGNDKIGKVDLSPFIPTPLNTANPKFHYSNTAFKEVEIVKKEMGER
tara:strand:+ start:4167 stop:5249 length:1083 start_codon:yes stop_codon:yes gene_type:complete